MNEISMPHPLNQPSIMINERIPYQPIPGNSFLALVLTAQNVNEETNFDKKTELFRNYINSIESDQDFQIALRFLGDGSFYSNNKILPKVGSRTVGILASQFCAIDYDRVFKPSKKAMGNTPATIQKLMENIPLARSKRKPEPIDLTEIEQILNKLSDVKKNNEKKDILTRIWSKMTGIEIKFFVKIIWDKSFKTGLGNQDIMRLLSELFEVNFDSIRYSYLITGDLGQTALLTRQHELQKAEFQLFHPLSFMLTTTATDIPMNNHDFYAEENLDGIRCQVHHRSTETRLYSGDYNDISIHFPDVIHSFQVHKLPDIVLDGVLCVYFNEIIQPLPILQKRMKSRKPAMNILSKYPVLFIAFDVLYYRNEITLNISLKKRRILLEQIASNYKLNITNQFEINSHHPIENLFQQAIEHGNNGLVLKNKNDAYKYGKRSDSWLTLKQKPDSFKVILMYAHLRQKNIENNISEFTIGIRVDNDERYREEFIPIGKIQCHFKKDDLHILNNRLNNLIFERYGTTYALHPEIVVEVEFDSILSNKKAKANYALESPKLYKFHWDLNSAAIHTLKDVERLYLEKLEAPRKKQGDRPSFIIYDSSVMNPTLNL